MAKQKIILDSKEIKVIADLPKDFGGLNQIKVRTPDGMEGWWVSQWTKGVWIRKEKGDNQVYPIFVEDLDECFGWEIVEIDENEK